MQATWRRIVIGSLGTFAVVLGFLAGRMNAGADAGLDGSATAHAKVVRSTPADPSASGTTNMDSGPTSGITSTPDVNPPVTASS
jgi:hypothetical protein